MKFLFIVSILLTSTGAFSQERDKPKLGLVGLQDWMIPEEIKRSEFRLLESLKNHQDIKNISYKISLLDNKNLRFIDSLETTNKQDTILLKIYSQNYRCHSSNIYKITFNGKSSVVSGVTFSNSMKNLIDDIEVYNNRKFDYKIQSKKYFDKQNNKSERIILFKTYY